MCRTRRCGNTINTASRSGGGSAACIASRRNAAPVYLIAFRDHTIRAAVAYWVDGNTLHYVTLEHESKQALLTRSIAT